MRDVFLRLDFAVHYRLNGRVVVVLVDFLVHGGLDLFMACWEDGLLDDSGSDLLVHGSVVVTRLGPRS